MRGEPGHRVGGRGAPACGRSSPCGTPPRPRETLVTPDHRYYVGDLTTTSPATVTSQGYVATLQTAHAVQRVEDRMAEIGDVERAALLAPRHIAFELPDSFTIDLAEFAVRKDRQLARYHTTIRPSYDLGFVFGTFLGDGHAFLNQVGPPTSAASSWYFGTHETELIDKFVRCRRGGRRGAADRRGREGKGDGAVHLHLYSLQWARLLGAVRQAGREAPACQLHVHRPDVPAGSVRRAGRQRRVSSTRPVASVSATPRHGWPSCSTCSATSWRAASPTPRSRPGPRAGWRAW